MRSGHISFQAVADRDRVCPVDPKSVQGRTEKARIGFPVSDLAGRDNDWKEALET